MNQQQLQRMATDPAYFRSQLLIEVSGNVVRYEDVAADWQEADFVAMDPAWLFCVGRSKVKPKHMRSLLTRPRGGSKTTDLAIAVGWALCFAAFPAKFISASGDRDQAKLLRDAIRRLCELNPWMVDVLEVQQWLVRNKVNGAELQVLSSDGATGFGLLVDAVLIDELFNWADTDQSQHFYHVLVSTMTKKQNCLNLIISNAGNVTTQWYPTYESIIGDESWYFHSLTTIPPWITEQQLAEQKRLLPPSVFSRLWENRWSSGTDSGISPADLAACTVLLDEQDRRQRGFDYYVAACDLGWRHDRTGVVVLAVSLERGQTHLAYCDSWHPQDHGGELPLSVVEDALIDIDRRFSLNQLIWDPREAVGLSQRLCDRGIPCGRMNLSADVQNKMAQLFLKAFNQRKVFLYSHSELQKDLLSMEVIDRTVGLKLQAARTAGGHSDLGFAFAMALLAAMEFQPMGTSDEVLVCT